MLRLHGCMVVLMRATRCFSMPPHSADRLVAEVPLWNETPYQRRPTRSTGPPRFVGVPTAPTPGVTAARATGRARSTTPGLTVQPAGYSTYWQYTTAFACSVLAATKVPISSDAENTIDSFIVGSFAKLSAGSACTFMQRLQVICANETGAGRTSRVDTDQAHIPPFVRYKKTDNRLSHGDDLVIRNRQAPQRFSRIPPSSPLAISVIRNTSNITAVDQPNRSTPFIAVMGPSRLQRSTGVTSPYPSVV